MLESFLKPYHDKIYKQHKEDIERNYNETRNIELKKLYEKGKKDQVHGAEKSTREKLALIDYDYLINYAGEITCLMARKGLLLKQSKSYNLI